jgi:DNA-binding CsgD family transcriptional regulator
MTNGVDTLSERQKEILRLIAQHLQAKEIARVLKISESTVKTHTDIARKRLGVATSRDAARLLVEHEMASGLMIKGVSADLPPGAIPLEGGWPLRPMAEARPDEPSLGHDKAIHTELTLPSGPLERSGDRLADAGLARKAEADRRDAERRADAQQERRPGEGGLHDDRRDSLADGRYGAAGRTSFERQLANLSSLQWLGLIAVTAVLLPLLAGVLIEALYATLHAIHHFNR